MRSNDQVASKQKSGREYKDKLLRVLFHDEEKAIELCNAITGANYPKDAKVTLCDMDNSLLRRYNDVAFAVEDQLLFVIEHQSNINTNMSLRLLFYVVDILFSVFIDMEKLYQKTRYKIPTPQFYVLYNGTDQLTEDVIKLSDSFLVKGEEIQLELCVKVIDVNYGSNSEVLKRSKSLDGYAYLIELIRRITKQGSTRDRAIHAAIKQCIEEDVLAEFLKENFEEVADMLGWQYDQEAEFRVIRREEREEGREEGREELKIEIALRMLERGRDIELIQEATGLDERTIRSLQFQQV